MSDKAFDESTLRIFLGRLNVSEIIDQFVIPMVDMVAKHADKPEESFHELTMEIVTQVRAYLVLHDRESLRDYPEVAQKKVFSLLLSIAAGKLEGEMFEKTFKDWLDSGKTFNQWRSS